MASVEENKASTAATSAATELEDDVKDLDIGGAAGVAAAKKDPNSKIGSNCMTSFPSTNAPNHTLSSSDGMHVNN
jgi:hypothetical protein